MGLWKASRLPGHPMPADDSGRVLRRPAVVGAGWLAAAVVATLIGLGGIRLVGESLTSTPGGVLSQNQVDQALAQASDPPTPEVTSDSPFPAPADTGTAGTTGPATTGPAPTTAPAAAQRSFSVRGGTAIAVCAGSQAYLVSWSPAQGYRVDRTRQGPDREVEVRFDGGHGHSEIKIRCAGGIPYAKDQDDD